MKYLRTLLRTLAVLGPLAVAAPSYATEPAQAYACCNGYDDPGCVYPYPYTCPYGGLLFFRDDDRPRHHFDRHFDHHFDHDGHHHGDMGSRGPWPWQGYGSGHGR